MKRSKPQRAGARYHQSRKSKLLALVLIGAGFSSSASIARTALAPEPAKLSLSQPLTVRWHYASSATLNLTPAADTERIYLPLAGGTIISLAASDGRLFWKSEMGGELSAAPAADDRAIYVAAETTATEGDQSPVKGSLRALGREAGVTSWLRTLPVAIRGSLAISDDRIFAGAGDGG